MSKGWLDKISQWISEAQLPEGAFRFALHDYSLVPIALSMVLSYRRDRVLVIAADSSRAEVLCSGLGSYLKLLGDERPIVPVEELVLGRHQWVPENEAGRCAALELALSGRPAIFVSTVPALMSRSITPKGFTKRTFTLRRGESIDLDELCRRLVELDYDNEFQVQQPGEFSRRGGILDIYSPLYDAPVRLEFWGDEIDSIRFFLPDSQCSFKDIEEVRVVPRGKAVLEAEESESAWVRDYFPGSVPFVLCGPDLIEAHLREYSEEHVRKVWAKTLSGAKGTVSLITEPGESSLKTRLGGPVRTIGAVSLGAELSALLPEMGDGATLWHWQQLRDSLLRWHRGGYEIVACCGGESEASRFDEMVKADPLTADLPMSIEPKSLDSGVVLTDAKVVLLSDHELFGRKSVRRRRRRHLEYRRDQALRDTTDLEEGGYAVHVTHGICIYHGIRMLESIGEVQEVIELEFDDDKRVYVPLDQAQLVSRYMGAGKAAPSLSKLGGIGWRRAKEAAGEAAWDLAAEMIRMEAMRQNAPGTSFEPQVEWERAFVASFPYEETADQAIAIEEVLSDMAKTKPMDRLLCGDVGYGKTEVAIRAAFRAVLNGKQVAVLVPTTILCEQHFQSFRERMASYPIEIESLSRFKTKGEQAEILSRASHGEVDIVIGTHRLLSKDVSFASLGLLIIDEEQRFGVEDKQQLKQMRANVDILTMTATPIPRTLYFSLSGLKSLSTIMTAPSDRLPVTTVVSMFDQELIRRSIVRELERGGQVFFLHNRVSTIDRMHEMISRLVPNARTAVAHGQMPPGRLEEVMTRFVAGEYDVLVCTTIIESGVDIPNANTIIIDRADKFGLSELYQLRGRVGRHHRQAYAYLLLPPMGSLPANARERLEAIRRYTHLGAGFKLALRDLEIRGAGNILGTEQSGHIAAVGFDLYCQLLKEAIANLEKRDLELPRQVDMFFDRTTFAVVASGGKSSLGIPAGYVEDPGARVDCYKTLSRMTQLSEVDRYAEELRDRFGPLPASVESLLDYTSIRVLAQKLKINRVNVRDQRLILETERGLVRDQRKQVPVLESAVGSDQLREVKGLLSGLSGGAQ
ncbi:MAG: transcription-repair coupling factor [Lentisphaerae bacterium]|jgi:transcription-repair coupling factor (superfamily II helicase)|nr:transcription-repair coupling factor [Lentisphaerota bacterium]